jgi:hypothetical protein
VPYAITSTQVGTTSGTSQKFTNPMDNGKTYLFTCEQDCWIKVTVTGGAAAADTANNIFVKAGMVIPLANPDVSGTTNAFVHFIQQTTAGDCSLARLDPA